MIYYSHIYVQSSMEFYGAMQETVWYGLRIPAMDPEVVDRQCMYWMGGEL